MQQLGVLPTPGQLPQPIQDLERVWMKGSLVRAGPGSMRGYRPRTREDAAL
jgi:hypothetical protein